MTNTSDIKSYHAHIYFDPDTLESARAVCESAVREFGVAMGHMHPHPVGPHPMGSCQLTASPDQFAALLPWLTLNRNGFIVFSHPDTGEHLQDHRDRGIWLGAGLDLKLSIFD